MVKVKKEALLVKPEDIKPSCEEMEVIGTLNPAAVKLEDGRILLYIRVIERLKINEDEEHRYSPRMVGKNKFELKIDKFSKKRITDNSEMDFLFRNGTKRLTFISHLRRVILDSNGFDVLSIDDKPSFYGIQNDGELGIEDARITKIEDKYVMTYVSLSRKNNVSTSVAFSSDCINWQRKGIIFGEQDKDVVIFPEKIRGEYVAFDRPEGSFQFSPPHVWIAYSPDLLHWGELKSITLSKKGDRDYGRNGAGPPPIKTPLGWLFVYHTVKEQEIASMVKTIKCRLKRVFNINDEECIERELKIDYRVGAALLNLKNPRKIISKSVRPIISATKDYEIGTFEKKSVVFPTGMVEIGEDILLYCGAGDRVVSVKEVGISDIIGSLKEIK